MNVAHGWVGTHLERLIERLWERKRTGAAIARILRDGTIGAGAALLGSERAPYFWEAPVEDPEWSVADVRRWRAITAIRPEDFLFPQRRISPALLTAIDAELWRPGSLDAVALLVERPLRELEIYREAADAIVWRRYHATTRNCALRAERLSLWALVAPVVRAHALTRLLATSPAETWSPFTRVAITQGISTLAWRGAPTAAYLAAGVQLPTPERFELAATLCCWAHSSSQETAVYLLESLRPEDLRGMVPRSLHLLTTICDALSRTADDRPGDVPTSSGERFLWALGHLVDGDTIWERALLERIDPEKEASWLGRVRHAPVNSAVVAWLLGRRHSRLREIGRSVLANGGLMIATQSALF